MHSADRVSCRRFRLAASLTACLASLGLGLVKARAEALAPALRISVYATAGDVLHHLQTPAQREQARLKLEPLRVSRLFLEGRRGDEYVPPALLSEVRDFFAQHRVECAGGIATVPGGEFGTRQDAELGWLNWESEKTQRDVAQFFRENAPVFPTLIVDDFYCTADTSPASVRARGNRSWGQYRQDLLVSLIDPMVREPARSARPDVRLILKYPQWYDRFHLFGYDPARMSAPFDQIWVGTEVRNPQTRRMGFVQPTEGYINFRWLASQTPDQVVGAWFDHIECSAQNFVDQAYQSVLAGARELTLFRLGDVMDGHPGDAELARRLPELTDLAARGATQRRQGVAYYKPVGSDAGENLYLADYLAMLGLPILPQAKFPAQASVIFLPQPAAADPQLLEQVDRALALGATVVFTPATLSALDVRAADWAGVRVGESSQPAAAARAQLGRLSLGLDRPLEVDASLASTRSQILAEVLVHEQRVPWFTARKVRRGLVCVLNARTFSETDFRPGGEWLLAPRQLGLPVVPAPLVHLLQRMLLPPLDLQLLAPAGVGCYAFERATCLYNFRSDPVTVTIQERRFVLPAHGWLWASAR